MGEGITKEFKHLCRWIVVQNILSGAYVDEHDKIKINVLHAAHMWNCAWDPVTEKQITNCFHKCGFCHIEEEEKKEAAREVVLIVDVKEDIEYDRHLSQRFCKRG